MKIYTKTGDAGQTGLFGGSRVSKSHIRVEAYGTVDELNAFIGLLHDSLSEEPVRVLLQQIQHRLFSIGAALAADPAGPPMPPDLKTSDITLLEESIDAMTQELPPLRHFILPGGFPTVSLAHVCRTVCRRAERVVVALHEQETAPEGVLQYLNRLSDYFFVLARHLGHQAGVEEIKWTPRT
ncbi:MAG: cob(I)yrinic acid a,c-diamide adenosyltransferase [Saprospiraceae bacterium]|nr:cob(I)yrinic acid a,c-diamide adenosyltransferase [Saprospiraceae bacterium]MDW8229166.1 cob(I)yrinic acid a,c-diamide adenosyltransferase [Saprospiraceae bacterium]